MKKILSLDPAPLLLGFSFLALPFASMKIAFFGIPLYTPEIFLTGAFLAHLGAVWKRKKEFLWIPDQLFLLGLCLFGLGALLATFNTSLTLSAMGMLKSWFFYPFLAFFLAAFYGRDRVLRNVFFLAWFLAFSIVALGSLTFLFQGVLTYDGRLAGMYTSPNFLAMLLAPIPLLALSLPSLFSIKNFWRAILLGVLCVGTAASLIALFATHSYGAWGATLVSLVFLFLFQIKNFSRKSILVGATLSMLVLGGLLLSESDSEKWQSLVAFDERSSLSSRFMIWQSAQTILSDHWLLGIGPGQFQKKYLEYQSLFPPYLEWAVPEPHNLFLAVTLSTGIIGLLGFLVLIVQALSVFGRIVWRTNDSPERRGALLALSFLMLTLVGGLVDTPYFKNDLALTFFLVLGLGFSCQGGQAKQKISS